MVYLFVGIWGILGSVSRYLLGVWTGGGAHLFPYPTLFINLLGCFILAFFYTVTAERFSVHPHFRTGFGTGFVGSFTTFSAFSYETLELVRAGHLSLAILYILLSLVGGYACTLLGIWLGNGREKEKARESRIE
ncbi:fluoride efflux transporter CrcB [Aneurinibacillus tyrosinisolvens]|uniref:fluoride efflux transporter CrcB n=1 Tax=Aneurinibacillus tyrosinisolvens TaxID=1443435 RepID=UPI00063EF8AD|nr:fluoride efflux transporter CrcB [Aneurinibacillus tyrosinisolvens]